ncbi:MAG: hypothetical protein U0987_00090 [Afipia sp.]|nr:hypothetical protein [Afipia sp.]
MREAPSPPLGGSIVVPSIIAEPAELQKLTDAFDAAWISINAAKLIEPLHVSAERERLGYILVPLWQSEPKAELVTLAAHKSTDQLCVTTVIK